MGALNSLADMQMRGCIAGHLRCIFGIRDGYKDGYLAGDGDQRADGE
jgi:hypothetical protein